MKATEQYFLVVLFIIRYKVVLTFESVDEILNCDHTNESYKAVLSCGTICMLYKIVHLGFEVRIANALTCQPLLYVGFIMVYNTMFWVNFASDNKQGAGKRLPTLLLSSLT